jgi:hypothetical protein
MEPYDPTHNTEQNIWLTNEIPAMLEALENHFEQATGISQAATLLRSLLLILEPGTPVTTWDERVLLRRAIALLTRRLQTLDMLETLTEE